MPSGLLLVDKPEGPTSAHVVARVKRILGAKKVGHLGTLDPFASGLLPLGIDDGTKVAEIFLAARKSYRGVIALGVATDTQDSTGKTIETREVPPLDDAGMEKLRAAFTGAQMQTPPMFSALKKDGVRLYSLARKGQTVERAPRESRERDPARRDRKRAGSASGSAAIAERRAGPVPRGAARRLQRVFAQDGPARGSRRSRRAERGRENRKAPGPGKKSRRAGELERRSRQTMADLPHVRRYRGGAGLSCRPL
jgi:hypothetical protein